MMHKTILEVENIIKHFNPNNGIFSSLKGNNGIIPAVDGVSFYIKENETMGLVGESGCGKTTIGRIILRLTTPTSGRVIFDGQDISSLTARLCLVKMSSLNNINDLYRY